MKKIPFTILYASGVEKSLRKLPAEVRVAVVKKLLALADNPFPMGMSKLQGALDLFRIRHGDYRIIYHVDHGTITVLIVKIGHRKEVYRKP